MKKIKGGKGGKKVITLHLSRKKEAQKKVQGNEQEEGDQPYSDLREKKRPFEGGSSLISSKE